MLMIVGLLSMTVGQVVAAASSGAAGSSVCESGDAGWRIVWRDDFQTLNTSAWNVMVGYDGGTGREAYLSPTNVYVNKGVLTLRSAKDDLGYNFTSGAVTTQNKVLVNPGRVCVTAQLPGGGPEGAGLGIWPAHWMMPNDRSCWPDHGEIDILEMIDGDGSAHATYHWNRDYPGKTCTYNDTMISNSTLVDNWDSQWHEYAVEWSPKYISFFVDGQVRQVVCGVFYLRNPVVVGGGDIR